MPFRNLPPLNFLPAFEAAARLTSFKAAAAELGLTPSAISQQVKVLEQALGVHLFVREGRTIRLTRDGDVYLDAVERALADIAHASTRLSRRAGARCVRLTADAFIAYEFILPRLSLFRARFADLELSFLPTTQIIDFSTTEVDVAIRIGDGPWPGLVARPLGDAVVAPVCAQEMAREIRSLADLRNHPVIEVRGQERRAWTAFMKAHGLGKPRRLLSFEGYLETLRAAEQGLGIAFGVFPMTTEWVLSGRLAVPLPVRLPLSTGIHFVRRRIDIDPVHEAFGKWLREQYAALRPLPEGRWIRRNKRATSR